MNRGAGRGARRSKGTDAESPSRFVLDVIKRGVIVRSRCGVAHMLEAGFRSVFVPTRAEGKVLTCLGDKMRRSGVSREGVDSLAGVRKLGPTTKGEVDGGATNEGE